MKLALVDDRRQEAQPNVSGTCPACERPVIAKCGDVRVWHWAHKQGGACDSWWENETEWHRRWKNQFPVDWQEIVHYSEDGERHIADVKTGDGWVIEFQHSYIRPEERRSRDAFYPKLIWVVDGLRRKTDRAQVERAWGESTPVGTNSSVRRAFSGDCRLLGEWSGSPAPVFIDFGEGHMLVWILAKLNGAAYMAPFPRASLVGIHRETGTQMAQDFDSFVEDLTHLVDSYESYLIRRR